MQTRVTFRHFKGQHPSLQEDAIQEASNFEKFYDGIISTDVEFINDSEKIVEFRVNIKGDTLVVREGSDDFHKSLSESSSKMVRKLRKVKTKRNSK
ncbi:MAG: HPF/RaiA family ribosome-associated protein [Candidatus Kapaibacterium sp.]